jgi:hypothetical protein
VVGAEKSRLFMAVVSLLGLRHLHGCSRYGRDLAHAYVIGPFNAVSVTHDRCRFFTLLSFHAPGWCACRFEQQASSSYRDLPLVGVGRGITVGFLLVASGALVQAPNHSFFAGDRFCS